MRVITTVKSAFANKQEVLILQILDVYSYLHDNFARILDLFA